MTKQLKVKSLKFKLKYLQLSPFHFPLPEFAEGTA